MGLAPYGSPFCEDKIKKLIDIKKIAFRLDQSILIMQLDLQ